MVNSVGADDVFIQLLDRRIEFLQCLESSSYRKPDMVDRLDWSRSTVDRAIRELQQAGLVKRVEEGYTATLAGRLAATAYTEFTETVSDIHTVSPLLETLDRDSPIPVESLRGVEQVPVDEHTPYDIPAELREAIESADTLTALVPVLADPLLLELCQSQAVARSLTLDLVVGPKLYEALQQRSPDTLSVLSRHGRQFLRAVRSPPHTVFLIERSSDDNEALVVVYEEGTQSAVFRNRRSEAFEATQKYITSIMETATEITDTTEPKGQRHSLLAPRRRTRIDDAERNRQTQGVLEREGFFELTDTYIESRQPGEPTTSWRTGIDFAEIAAGHAVERTYDSDGTTNTETGAKHDTPTDSDTDSSGRTSLVSELLGGLRSGDDHALVGLPGSGKSTVCKMVAHRWHETDRGTVFYREGGAGRTFTSTAALRARLRESEDHALVVVEDVLSPEANAVFRVMADCRDDPTVTFLVESREHAWSDPSASSSGLASRLDSYRTEAIEHVRMPPLDVTECERLIDHFEAMSGRRPTLAASDLLDCPGQDSDPATLLVVLHRLVLSVDPLASVRDTTPTTLTEDVRRTYDDLLTVGDRALDVGVLVSLLNAADIGVHPELVHAITLETATVIEEALTLLEGRVIFDRSDSEDENETDSSKPSYRSVHKSWSVLFLRQLHERASGTEELRAAKRRFGRIVTALLSLADDKTHRACIDWRIAGSSTILKEISSDPQAWADETTERLFSLGLTHASLVPLFGTSTDPWIELPEACSADMTVRCTEWRGKMALYAGSPDKAATEFERLATLADDPPASIDGDRLGARSLKFRGTVAFRRSKYDRAESFYNRSRRAYRTVSDERGEADVVNNLGIVAWARGELAAAKERLQWSLDRYYEFGDRVAAADARFNRAMVLDVEGDTETALEQYGICLDRYRSVGNCRSEANTLNNLGVLKRKCGEINTAERHLSRAFDTYRDVGDEHGQASSLHGLGYIAQTRGNFERATECYERSLHRYRDASDTHGVARCLHDRATIDLRRGNLDAAKRRDERSYDLRVDIGDQRGIAACLINLGRIARRTGATRTAVDRTQCGLDRYRQHGDVRGVATALRLLGALHRDAGRVERADDCLGRSLEQTRESNHRLGEARTLCEMGRLAEARNHLQRAKDRHESALSMFIDMGARPDAVETGHELTAVCAMLDASDAAATHRETTMELARDIGLDPEKLNRRSINGDRSVTEPNPPATDGTGTK